MSEMNEDSRLPARAGSGYVSAVVPSSEAVATFEQFDPYASPLREYMNVLLRRKWTVLISFVVIFAIAGLFTATTPRIYEATATLLVSHTRGSMPTDSDNLPPMMGAIAAPTLETHVDLIRGESNARETAAWLRAHGGPALTAGQVRQSIRAGVVANTQLVRLSARAQDPKEAEKIANATAQSYVAMNRRWAQSSSESASKYISEQLAMAKDNLSEAENGLRAFKESTGTVAEDAAAGDLLGRVTALRADIEKTRADLAQGRARLAKLRGQLAQQNKSIEAIQVRDNAVVQQLRARLVELEGQRLAAESRYTSEFSGPVSQLDDQIRIVKDQLNAEIRNIVRGGSGDLLMQQTLTGQLMQDEVESAALQARERQLHAELTTSERELEKIPARQITLARLQRQVEVAQKIHSDLLTRSQEVEVGRVMALGNADVVEPASEPRAPAKPNVPLNWAFGLLLGLAVGLGLALLQEHLDDTVRGEEDIARLAGRPVLGTVPMFQRHEGAVMLPEDKAHRRALEAYRSLRYNLGFVTPGQGGHTILVTSAGPLEGKTTTALNLAVAAALSGRRVVLIDSDLRRPAIHRLLGLNGPKGLSDLLVGEAEVAEVFQGFKDTGLRVITSRGHVPNPADLLDSSRMRELVAQLRKEADLIIFDSPPLLSAADSLVLAGLSDAVLMVCVPGASHRRDIQRAQTLLGHIGHSISGVVLNKVERRPGYGYYYGYYYYDHDRDESDSIEDGETETPSRPM